MVKVEILPHGEGLGLPAYATSGAAGMDLALAIEEPVALAPAARLLAPTGLILSLPQGWEGQIRPRSGLALKHGITLLNSPGTLDWDYRGEVKLLLINLGDAVFTLERGLRAAQLVVAPVARAELVEGAGDKSQRGAGGFGSTGLASKAGINASC